MQKREQENDSDSDSDEEGYDIKVIDSKTTHFKGYNTNQKNNTIPKHPFSALMCGSTGSGKSNLIVNLVTRKKYYKGFFDEIYLLTPTPNDDMQVQMGIPEENVISEDFIENLDEWVKEQEAEIDSKGITKSPKTLIIFEDCTSNKKLMRSKSFIKAFVQNRHLNLSVMVCCHKYKALTRTCRMNCSTICYFQASKTEDEALTADHGANGLNKNEFLSLVDFATTPDESNKKPFLYINVKIPMKTRYRKCFSTILQLK